MTLFALCATCHEEAYQDFDRTHPWTCPDCGGTSTVIARLIEQDDQ